MKEHDTNLIELLVNNKKKKRSDDNNKDLRVKLFEILDVLINEEKNQNNSHDLNVLKKSVTEFFNLYININTYIQQYHANNIEIEKDIKDIISNMVDNAISKVETINNVDLTKVINLVKEKKEKIQFINIEKIT